MNGFCRGSVGSGLQDNGSQAAVGGPGSGPEGSSPFRWRGRPPDILVGGSVEVPVCPPQVQVLGPLGVRPVVPASAGGVVPSPSSELRRLQQLRDDARWAEHQQVILRMGAPAFVPVVDRPG